MSATAETLRLIELTSGRLHGGIAAMSRRDRTEGSTADELLLAAWGPDNDRPLTSDRLRSLASGLPGGVTVDQANLTEPCAFPPHLGRVVLNLLLLAAASLPRGGVITLVGSPDDLVLQITGPDAAWPAGMAGCVVDQTAAATRLAELMPPEAGGAGGSDGANGVQMPLTALLAHTLGIRISFLLAASSRGGVPMLRLGGH